MHTSVDTVLLTSYWHGIGHLLKREYLTFITNNYDDRIVYIKNTSKNKVLGVINNGRVIEEPIIKGKLGQLWEREREYEEGFYTLRNSESLEVLTAISPKILEIKGNFKVTVASLPLFF